MSIKLSREEIDLTYPTSSFKQYWWDKIRIPTARIEHGYKPIPEIEKVHFHPARIRLLAGGARLGKSLFIAMEAIPWAFHSNLIWLLGPDYAQTRQEFIYIMEGLVSIGATSSHLISLPANKSHPASLETEWGCHIETMTTQDPEKIASKPPDIIFMCEPGQIQDGIYERARERLTTRRGPLVLAGTFEDNSFNWFTDHWSRWRKWPNDEDARSFSVPMWANTYTFPNGRNDTEVKLLEATLDRNTFLRRIAGVPTPSLKLIVGDLFNPKLRNGEQFHIGWYPFEKWEGNGIIKPVSIYVDPGWGSDSYYYIGALQWDFDEHGMEIYRQIDEIAVQKKTHKQVIREVQSKNWWPNVISGVVEPWGGEQHPLGNRSVIEEWADHAGMILESAPKLPLDERIGVLRDHLICPDTGKPRIYFNEKTTPRIQYEMKHWKRVNQRSAPTKPAKPSLMNCDGLKGLSAWLTNRRRPIVFNRPKVHDVRHII